MKAFIFDQDGTLYPASNPLTAEVRRLTKQWIAQRLNVDQHEIDRLYLKLQQDHPNPVDGFSSIGLTIPEYHAEVFDKVDPRHYLKRDRQLIRAFHESAAKKFVVTLASRKYSEALLRTIGIADMLEEIVIATEHGRTKDHAYMHLCKKYSLQPADVCVVGDSPHIDLEPATAHGFPAVLVGPRGIDTPQQAFSTMLHVTTDIPEGTAATSIYKKNAPARN